MTVAHQAGLRQPHAAGEYHVEGPISTKSPVGYGGSCPPARPVSRMPRPGLRSDTRQPGGLISAAPTRRV